MKPDSWEQLKQFTAARIALGRAGASVPTGERLAFQLAHARARDAVMAPFDTRTLASQFEKLPLATLVLDSCAPDRLTYLRRPDLGRKLSDHSRATLQSTDTRVSWDLVVLVSDGLSALAATKHAPALLALLLPKLLASGWRLAPLLVVAHARVAVQDEIGGCLNAGMSLMLLGERPGLGSPDSLGAYLTFHPRPGKTDADRNCVSNIRPEGLPVTVAAEKLFDLLNRSRQLQLSGVGLKDDFALPAFSPPDTKCKTLCSPDD
jgi:ethanolamine ammonia-lyase small subunit